MIDTTHFYAIYFEGHGYLYREGGTVQTVDLALGFKEIPDPIEWRGYIMEQTGPLSYVEKHAIGRVVKVTMLVEEVDE